MRRLGPTTVAGGAFRTHFTVPAGKKYELVELWVNAANAVNVAFFAGLGWSGGVFLFFAVPVLAPGTIGTEKPFEGLVFAAGETLQTLQNGAATNYTVVATYIEVDV